MKVSLSAVADYASISHGEKLNVMGVFDTIFSRVFPARHAAMVFALRLLFEWEDAEKQHALRIHLEDEDGHKAFEVEGRIEVGRVEPGMFQHHNQIIALRDVVFRKEGHYKFVVKDAAGTVVVEHPLRLVKLAQQT